VHIHILDHTFEEYLEIVKTFHGAEAPGVVIGGFMVDMALKGFPDGVLYDAICETRSCLPDAIQLLTPCTIGNGWLKIIPLGRFAICLYDKGNYEGVRVFLDAKKMEAWQEIKAWLFKLKSKEEQDRENIIREISNAGASILSMERVKVRPEIAARVHKGKISMCPRCREAYPSADGELCLACQGGNPYQLPTWYSKTITGSGA
jgi:formylmethanofuran dehydrogenase subunit E